MSSLRRVQSPKANGALSKGPSTPAAKQRSSLNAIRHGLCAKCIVADGESRENFPILLQQHVDRFRPAGEVEFGMIEEMCAAYWRQRRAWSLETGMFNKQMANQPDGGMTDRMMDRMVGAFDTLAASPSLSLLHRCETRLHESPAPTDKLMEEVVERQHLRRAWKRVKANQGSPGVEG